MKIYTQASAGLCGNYAFLYALQKAGVNITEAQILDLFDTGSDSAFGFTKMSSILRKRKYITSLGYPLSVKQVEQQLARGHWLPCKINRNNFDSARVAPFINDCQGIQSHYICLVQDLGDRFKYIDQQGPNWGDKGYAYVMKSNFRNLTVAKINL